MERKIEIWTLNTSATEENFRQGKVPVDKENQNNLPIEVLELEKFLQQTGGRYGGWDEYDHQVFLKLWTKHKGKPSYMEEAQDYFPEKKKDDIQKHEKWYQEFLILETRKKEVRTLLSCTCIFDNISVRNNTEKLCFPPHLSGSVCCNSFYTLTCKQDLIDCSTI